MSATMEALQEMLDFTKRIYILHFALVAGVVLIAVLLFIWWKKRK